jgi:hypothetical protein
LVIIDIKEGDNMFVTNISLAYVFLGLGVIAAFFFVYFKVIVARTEPGNSHRGAIVGEMKDPDNWRAKNNRMSYLSLFWSVLSVAIFIYIKYFNPIGVISIVYPFIYIGIIVVSVSFASRGNKRTAH